jgi:hypothetical protein
MADNGFYSASIKLPGTGKYNMTLMVWNSYTALPVILTPPATANLVGSFTTPFPTAPWYRVYNGTIAFVDTDGVTKKNGTVQAHQYSDSPTDVSFSGYVNWDDGTISRISVAPFGWSGSLTGTR